MSVNIKCVNKMCVILSCIGVVSTGFAAASNLLLSAQASTVANRIVKEPVIAEPQIAGIGKSKSDASQSEAVYVLKQKPHSIYGASQQQDHFLKQFLGENH